MSDSAQTLTPAPEPSTPAPAPEGTAGIAASVLSTLEAEAATTPAPEEPHAAGTTPDPESPAPAVVEPPKSDAEQLLDDAGFKAKRSDGRENWIPYSKVAKIIENGLKEGKGQFGSQFKAAQEELTSLRPRAEQLDRLASLLDQGPEAVLSFAAQHDPRYREFLTARATPAAPAAPALPADLPEPDYALPDGSKTYSIKGIREQVIPWIVAEAKKEAKREAEASLKPITEERQAAKAQEQVRSRVQSQLDTAKSWPEWDAHEAGVLAALRADTEQARTEGRRPTLSLREAYLQVRLDAQTAQAKTARDKVLEELKSAPAATSVARGDGGTPPPTAGRRSTAEIAAAELARLSR